MPWSEWIKEPVCWLVCYLIIANLAGFAMMGIDKYKAKHERWRIRERTLMLTAAFCACDNCVIEVRERLMC